jgi:hypothetical protein
MVVNSNTGMMFSMLSEWKPRDAIIEELLGDMFYMRSVPRCFKKDKSKILISCETVAS